MSAPDRTSRAVPRRLRVAVVGTGDIGCGWASLCAAAGWPVTLYDTDSRALQDAPAEVEARARALVQLDRAEAPAVDTGLRQLGVGRSLLQACGDAEWIIEAVHEDLGVKQKLFEAIEPVAEKARAITSSASALDPKDIAARCRRQDRCFVAHPLNPPEIIPLVELVPTPHIENSLLEVVKGWLWALGRVPVVIRKPVPGNVAGRIAAAVWREAIALVLDGVIDVADLDRATSVGPALGWAAAGPHLTYHLAASDRGVEAFLQHLLQTFENVWEDLSTWSKLEPEQQRKLIRAIERTYEERIDELRQTRDRRLAAVLKALEHAKVEEGDA
jgi:3-hydroxypropionate dehydrogenase (NADP+)